jgi:hypothetical protein
MIRNSLRRFQAPNQSYICASCLLKTLQFSTQAPRRDNPTVTSSSIAQEPPKAQDDNKTRVLEPPIIPNSPVKQPDEISKGKSKSTSSETSKEITDSVAVSSKKSSKKRSASKTAPTKKDSKTTDTDNSSQDGELDKKSTINQEESLPAQLEGLKGLNIPLDMEKDLKQFCSAIDGILPVLLRFKNYARATVSDTGNTTTEKTVPISRVYGGSPKTGYATTGGNSDFKRSRDWAPRSRIKARAVQGRKSFRTPVMNQRIGSNSFKLRSNKESLEDEEEASSNDKKSNHASVDSRPSIVGEELQLTRKSPTKDRMGTKIGST